LKSLADVPGINWNRIKLALFDVDGTLVGVDGGISSRVKTAIANIQQLGIATAVASGRPPFATEFLFDELNLIDVGSFYAGACLYDPVNGRYIDTIALNSLDVIPVSNSNFSDSSELRRLLTEAQEQGCYCEVYTTDRFFVESITPIYQAHSRVLRAHASQARLVDVIDQQRVVKLLIGGDQTVDAFALQALETKYAGFQFAYAKMHSHPDWLFASVISRQIDRVSRFQQLCRYHQLSSEQVLTFGDAQSDQVFIQSAGIGVAMGNAPVEVKAVADIVTDSVEEDGVALVLEQLLAAKTG